MLIKLIVLGMMKYLIEVKLILEHEAAFDGLTQPYINMIEAQTAPRPGSQWRSSSPSLSEI